MSSSAHVRSSRSADETVKVEAVTGGTGRPGGGMPGQGFSKYQKSLPPRFQRQQQVCVCSLDVLCSLILCFMSKRGSNEK